MTSKVRPLANINCRFKVIANPVLYDQPVLKDIVEDELEGIKVHEHKIDSSPGYANIEPNVKREFVILDNDRISVEQLLKIEEIFQDTVDNPVDLLYDLSIDTGTRLPRPLLKRTVESSFIAEVVVDEGMKGVIGAKGLMEFRRMIEDDMTIFGDGNMDVDQNTNIISFEITEKPITTESLRKLRRKVRRMDVVESEDIILTCSVAQF